MLGHSKYLNNCHSINSQPKNSFYSQIMVIISNNGHNVILSNNRS